MSEDSEDQPMSEEEREQFHQNLKLLSPDNLKFIENRIHEEYVKEMRSRFKLVRGRRSLGLAPTALWTWPESLFELVETVRIAIPL